MPRAKKIETEKRNSESLDNLEKLELVKKERKRTHRAKKVVQRSEIWDINRILIIIFSYTDYKDLIKFNTVCKRWHQLTNPIIHRSIKLLRSTRIINKSHDKSLNKAGKIDAEVTECIANNAKYANLVKRFEFSAKVKLQRVIEFFELFQFITELSLSFVDICQDQFIGIIKPLSMLKELNLHYVNVKSVIKNRIYTKSITLPPTLTKLALEHTHTSNNPELFIQTINSHTNLKEFIIKTYYEYSFLEPFSKGYSSLKTFEYINRNEEFQNTQYLLDMIKFNPQLIELTIGLICMNNVLTSHLSQHLINLEVLNLFEYPYLNLPNSTIYIKFPQSTNIKKLKLIWDKLSPCSIESILSNCIHLDDLELMFYRSYRKVDTLSFNLIKPTKIKKLKIECDHLSELTFDCILLQCPQLKELEVQVPRAWRKWTDSIGSRCLHLEKLTIIPMSHIYREEAKLFKQQLNEMKFLINNPIYQSTLTNLTLHEFDLESLKDQHLANFEKLQSIVFKWYCSTKRLNRAEINSYMDFLTGFKARKFGNNEVFDDIEFYKV